MNCFSCIIDYSIKDKDPSRPHHRGLTLYQLSFVPNSRDRIFYYRYRTIRIETAFCLRASPSGFFSNLGIACLKPLWSLEEGRGQWDTPPAHTCTTPVFGSCISATCTRSLPLSFASHTLSLLPLFPSPTRNSDSAYAGGVIRQTV